MFEVLPFEESRLGATLDFAVRARPEFGFSWAEREALFRWKYLEQVQALPDQPVPAWIVCTGERVVGFLGAAVSDFWFAGRTLPGLAAMDLYLEPACRGHGLSQRLLDAYEAAAPLKLMVLSTPRAHELYLRRGYQELTGVRACHGIWGLRGILHWLGRRTARVEPAGAPPEPADRLRNWLLGRPGVGLVAAAEAPALDAFLRRAQETYQLAPRRLTAALLWKYRHHPDRHGEVFTLQSGGELQAVFALANRRASGPPQLVLGDLFLARPDDRDAIRRVLGFCRQLTGRLGAHSTVIIDPGASLGDALGRATLTRHHLLRCSLKVAGDGTVVESARCYLSAGDGDFIR